MNENWIFIAKGMIIKAGLKLQVKSGTLGVTDNHELVLFDDNDQVIVHASVSQAIFRFSVFLGDSIKVNDKTYHLSFEPPMKISSLLLGGVIGSFATGMEHSMKEEVKVGKQNREEFMVLIEKLQAS